jgi:hypothetical protein
MAIIKPTGKIKMTAFLEDINENVLLVVGDGWEKRETHPF